VGLPEPKPVLAAADSSLTSAPAHFIPLRALSPPNTYDDDLESSARVVTARGEDGPVEAPLPPDRPAYNSRAWRAEAWKREQEREKRSARSLPTPRRRSIA
jgi:hypothetical protein